MAYFFFLDESGQDQRESPYEVLATVAVEELKLWPMIQDLQQAEKEAFGTSYRERKGEIKAKKFLNKKAFRLASQMPAMDDDLRRKYATRCLSIPEKAGRLELTAIAQAKIEYVKRVLDICLKYDCKAFASIIGQDTERPSLRCPRCYLLRKDYLYLFERFYYFLEDMETLECGIVVFDELERTKSHLLINQMDNYFKKTQKGIDRSALLIPEPFFVHSDLTTGIQLPDFVAYIVSWGFRKIKEMNGPARAELSGMVESVCNMRYLAVRVDDHGKEFKSWSFVHISDLCDTLEKAKHENNGKLNMKTLTCSRR